ncbi:methyltransferase, FkbM family [Aeromicrobium marinum DSM 15272]|uniref:Methyltransferase, FkbM family n=1 Tax=Aeromicrobium marinum DSM 15272 TaxID=585531 RepID=E2SAY0_9ACTN|nr:FkbM family methyltransferase [Aeromicrobium marinum]EFQ83526.1 methyltransferase, FkbM family [Aeromicrobium marinum DSM 15272]
MSVTFVVRQLVLRVRQVFTHFDNPWAILWSIATRRQDVVFEVDGLRVRTLNSPAAWGPVLEVFVEDEYAFEWFTGDLRSDAVAVDIGAHVGCFAMAFARRFPGGSVASYEPTPSTGEYTVGNVETNGLAERVTVHRMAVAARTGSFRMADNGPGRAHNGVLYLGQAGSTTIEVAARSFVEVMADAGDTVDLVKLDAEGAEYDILLGTDPGLLAPVRRFVLEFHPSPDHHFGELRTHLESAGLELVRETSLGPDLGLAWFSRDPLDRTA